MLRTRIITALVLVSAFIPALFMLSNMAWAICMLAITLLAVYEWGALVSLKPAALIPYTLACAALGGLMLVLMESHGFHWFFNQSLVIFMLALAFWLIFVPVWLAKRFTIQNKWLLALLGLLLMAPLWLALVCARDESPWLLLMLLSTIWLADIVAYVSGKNFGRNKLAPSISPGKTWEGVFGALAAVTIFACILYASSAVDTLAIFPVLWVVAVLGVMGDLLESLVKRQQNKKDSGHLLPGHGGILDRIDGLIPSLPIAILMIYLFHSYKGIG